MDINDKTDVLFVKNCGKAITKAHHRFQQILADVVDTLIQTVPRFDEKSVMPHVRKIRETLEGEMENGERLRFLKKDNANKDLQEITDDKEINKKIFERMKKKKSYNMRVQKNKADSIAEKEIAMRILAERDPDFLKKICSKHKLEYHPASPKNKKRIMRPTQNNKANLKTQHNKLKERVVSNVSKVSPSKVPESNSTTTTLPLLDPSLPPPHLQQQEQQLQPSSEPQITTLLNPLSKSPSSSSSSSSSSFESLTDTPDSKKQQQQPQQKPKPNPNPNPTPQQQPQPQQQQKPKQKPKAKHLQQPQPQPQPQPQLIIKVPIQPDFAISINRYIYEATPEGNCGFTSIMHQLNIDNYPKHTMNMYSNANVAKFRRWCSYEMMNALLDPSIIYVPCGEKDDCKTTSFGYNSQEIVTNIYCTEYHKQYMPRASNKNPDPKIPEDYWFDIGSFGLLLSFVLKKSFIVEVYAIPNETKSKIEYIKYDPLQPNKISNYIIQRGESDLEQIVVDPNNCIFLYSEYMKHFDVLIDNNHRKTSDSISAIYKRKRNNHINCPKYHITDNIYKETREKFDRHKIYGVVKE